MVYIKKITTELQIMFEPSVIKRVADNTDENQNAWGGTFAYAIRCWRYRSFNNPDGD